MLNYRFRRHNLETLLGGVSSLDLSFMSIDSTEDAHDFLTSYGFDWSDEEDRKKLMAFYQKALVFMKTSILEPDEEIPAAISDLNEFKDLRQLLVNVNQKAEVAHDVRLWSCALLKVLHVIIHFSHDMYSIYPEEIQSQILGPINAVLQRDPVAGSVSLQKEAQTEVIKLYKFEQKPVKDFRSSIIKLLAKRKLFALNIYDNIGVRFVTRNIFDSFRVCRFLTQNGILNSMHSITDQSANSIYPTNLFLEVMDGLRTRGEDFDSNEVNAILLKKLEENKDRAEYLEKENTFSGEGHSFIKFISRRLIRVEINGEQHRFFYPFEVQIVTQEDYLQSFTGDQAHHAYKDRQRVAARKRLLGLS